MSASGGLTLSRTTLGIAAGVAGFLAYCFYFDWKRRKDPDFKKKLKARRAAQAKAKRERSGRAPNLDINDVESMQKYFYEQMQLGEEALTTGDIDNGVTHLANAITICGPSQGQQLLQVLRQTLPPPVFGKLLEQLPAVGQRLMGEMSLLEDELE